MLQHDANAQKTGAQFKSKIFTKERTKWINIRRTSGIDGGVGFTTAKNSRTLCSLASLSCFSAFFAHLQQNVITNCCTKHTFYHIRQPNNDMINTTQDNGVLVPSESSTQTASRSIQPFLQGSLVWQTDRQTDHATRSVATGRIYVRSRDDAA